MFVDKELFGFDLGELPEDPELAFVEFASRVQDYYDEKRDESWQAERRFVSLISAYLDENEMDFLELGEPPFSNEDFSSWYMSFCEKLNYIKTRIALRHRKRERSGLVTVLHLNDNYRSQIHSRLNQVRDIVRSSDLDEKKKDAIFSKISDLQAEIDKSRTRLDAFLSIQLDISEAIGKSAKNLEPVVQLLESIKKVFVRARSEEKLPALSNPSSPRLLEKPKKNSHEMDDEIPF